MKERFLSYAQEYEDLILYHVLHDVKNGFYVDVGANDPLWISVTKAFYERGWSGINIEPLSDKHKELVADRPRDINLCMGAGNEKSELTLYQSGATSTLNENSKRSDETIRIPVDTLTNIICNALTPHPMPGMKYTFAR